MSSDSEDDCYGNIAQKLQSIKNKYKEDKIETTNLLNDSFNADHTKIDEVVKIVDISGQKYCEALKDDSDIEEMSLDAIIAENIKKRPTRSAKYNIDVSADNILPTRCRLKSKANYKSKDSVVERLANVHYSNQSLNTPGGSVNTTRALGNVNSSRGRGRDLQRGRRRGNTTVNNVNASEPPTSIESSPTISSSNSSRSRRGCRGRTNTPRRCRRRQPDISLQPSNSQIETYPTYNIGDFGEYPDECYNQPLFKNQTEKTDDVMFVGENEPENDSIDENEELSVKVYWQNCEYVKFAIRRFQKLKQIFDFFANRENVSHDKLFFTYNDKILKIDDTPDSITYSIVKFIDGGIITQSVSKIVQNDRNMVKDGIKLKFQCQNVKKPFEMMIRPDDKMAVVMMMVAEHLERPLEKLKFHFDGDLITGKKTPRDLELEGGECIDVKIIS